MFLAEQRSFPILLAVSPTFNLLVNALESGSGSLLVIQAACYWRQKNEFSSMSLPSSLQNTSSYDA